MSESIEDVAERIMREKAGKPKHAGGRPTKYDAKVHPDLVATSPHTRSATWTDIAEACGVSESTVKLWADKYPEFSAAVTYAKNRADNLVENALFRRALGDWKNPPDTKACIIWLGNRRPDKWRESSRVEVTGKDGEAVKVEHIEGVPTQELIAEAEALLAEAAGGKAG